jgi:hypothetical protein
MSGALCPERSGHVLRLRVSPAVGGQVKYDVIGKKREGHSFFCDATCYVRFVVQMECENLRGSSKLTEAVMTLAQRQQRAISKMLRTGLLIMRSCFEGATIWNLHESESMIWRARAAESPAIAQPL